MGASRNVIVSGLAALLVGLSVVALISLSGVPAVRLVTGTPGPVTSVNTTTSQGGTVPSGTTTTSSQGPVGNQGTLSVLLTDPPHVPTGVTAVYVYYIGLAVHGDSGWTTVKQDGVIELLGTVGQALTLSSATVPAGTYDGLKFEVTSAQVTYQGANHSAIVQGGKLTVKIEGGALVSASEKAGALIDIQPTVMNIGTSSSPSFVLWATARAFQVPSAQMIGGVEQEGHRFSLTGYGWWDNDDAETKASITLSQVSLSPSSLGLTVKDTGTSGTELKLVIVSSSNIIPGTSGADSVPDAITSTAVFVLLNNGTMIQFLPLLHTSMPMVRGENQMSVYDALLAAGYNLTAGTSTSFKYSGTIELSFGLFVQAQGIASGSTYWVTVIGDNSVATTQVTSS